MYIKRTLEANLINSSQEYSAIAVLGPRQSGKTTLVREIFPKHAYLSLENPDIRERAAIDPHGFLNSYKNHPGVILDEIQHLPQLLSYIQTIIDLGAPQGFFIITGSQNFLLNQAISQTLAGRIAILTLLPLSIAELNLAQLLPDQIEILIFNGSYPAIYNQKRTVSRLYQGYTNTYLERDIRQLKNISDLSTFKKFIGLCAGRVGQEINFSSLSNDCGIDQKTVRSWLSVLEASYIIFLLQPYYRNFGKRLIKSPKLYFIDTGLACSLLRIKSSEELLNHALRGALVESLVISDLLKQQYNHELLPSLYFWRDATGNEVDCVIDEGQVIVPIEIKSSQTIIPNFFKGLAYWRSISKTEGQRYVIYGGKEDQVWTQGQVLSWQNMGNLIKLILNQKPSIAP